MHYYKYIIILYLHYWHQLTSIKLPLIKLRLFTLWTCWFEWNHLTGLVSTALRWATAWNRATTWQKFPKRRNRLGQCELEAPNWSTWPCVNENVSKFLRDPEHPANFSSKTGYPRKFFSLFALFCWFGNSFWINMGCFGFPTFPHTRISMEHLSTASFCGLRAFGWNCFWLEFKLNWLKV